MNESDPRREATELGLTAGPNHVRNDLSSTEDRLPVPGTPDAVTEVARLQLREERAFVERRREIAGQVLVRREVERRVETIEIELLTETVVIEVRPGSSGVFLDGEPLLEGESREIVTYREEAEVVKKPVVSEEVRVLKRVVNRDGQFSVDLGREVLRVEHVDASARVDDTPGLGRPVTGEEIP